MNLEFAKNSERKVLTKEDLKSILTLAKSDRQRETIRYSVYRASDITSNQAQKRFGLQNMALEVEKSIAEVREIRYAIDEMVNTQDVPF